MANFLTRSKPKNLSTKMVISAPSVSPFTVFILSDSHLEKVFGFLSYHELTSTRSVCRWFYHVVGSVMNKKFKCLSKEVDLELEEERTEDEPSESRLKVLSVLQSEIHIIESHCLYYVEASMFYFFGGMILDFVDYILREKKNEEVMTNVSELFLLVDHFLNTFDSVSEPILLERSYHLPFSWFAKKFVDIVESYACAEYFVAVKSLQNGTRVKWTGKYTGMPVHSLLPPPFIPNSTEGVKGDMDVLLKYVRNLVRWNNILDIIKDSSVASKKFEDRVTLEDGSSPYGLQDSEQRLICERLRLDGRDFCGPKHLEINIGLFAHEIFAPSRFKGLFEMMTSFGKSSGEEDDDSKSTEEPTTKSLPQEHDYEMDLTIEISYKEQGGDVGTSSYRTRTYQICHIDNRCYIASNTAIVN